MQASEGRTPRRQRVNRKLFRGAHRLTEARRLTELHRLTETGQGTTAAEVVLHHVGRARRRGRVFQVGVRRGRGQAQHQTVL